MEYTGTVLITLAASVLAALGLSVGMAGVVHFTRSRPNGYMHLIFYAMLSMIALDNLLSGRDLTLAALSFEEIAPLPRHPFMAFAQPLTSLLLLTVAAERILTYCVKADKSVHLSPLLAITFILFWAGTVAAPANFGAHPVPLSHDHFYPLVIGVAALLSTGAQRDLAIRATRNALVVFIVLGLLVAPFRPELVMELYYSQGLVPGLPRLAGLASHGVSMGILAELGLLCLMAFPYRRAWLNRAAWAAGLGALFLAQSKTAWISFLVCSSCIVVVRKGGSFWRRLFDPLKPEFGLIAFGAFIFVVMAGTGMLLFGDVDAKVMGFFDSPEGAQLTSLTGRDQIWAVAWEEWSRNPSFGYGINIWDATFRISIGMPNAVHAHNQFMDSLSRSGTVGAATLVFYSMVLLVLSVRYARASGGFTLALFVALALRSISEVPLSLFGYGTELITHVLLLMALAAGVSEERVLKSLKSGVSRARAARAYARITPVTSFRVRS